MFDDFIRKVEELRQKNEVFATATVVRREVPSSGRSGDKAVIDRRGEISGWVGGGCVQAIILKEADEAMRTGKARLVKVGRSEERGSGDTGASGRQEFPGGQPQPHASQEGVVEYKMTCLSEGAVDIFIEPVLPAPHLVVVGKSAIARALVRIGKSAGYRVSAVAPDVRPDTFDHPDELITQLDLKQVRTNTSSSFIVICTQGEQDELALEQALGIRSAYVGFVASKKKKATLFDYLEQSGIDRQRLATVRSPAGININAKSPEEVAVSILAEIIQVQHELPEEADRPKYYINPVCGMPVDVNNPKHVIEYKGELVYFCCDGCKVKFEEAPEKYVAGNVR
ncbi:MAG TPA: XdhC family protein [Puia sp.]